jgi:hypothetical protein
MAIAMREPWEDLLDGRTPWRDMRRNFNAVAAGNWGCDNGRPDRRREKAWAAGFDHFVLSGGASTSDRLIQLTEPVIHLLSDQRRPGYRVEKFGEVS